MRDVEPDEKVSVKYLRDGKSATATVCARNRRIRMVNFRCLPVPGRAGGNAALCLHARPMACSVGAELVALTPKLGQYFGSDKGLLVVRAPAIRV